MPLNLGNHKAIDPYYAALANYRAQGVTHEQALRLAFSTLLDALKPAGWTLVLEQRLSNRKRPDGTLYDEFRIPRGYWEAKDTDDDLQAEIRAKINRGYPLTNTIFEDTRRAVLFQHGRLAFEADLSKRGELVALLEQFLGYTGAQVEEFNAAVRQFQTQIPELARGLLQLIEQEREQSPRFVAAFAEFERMCRSAINPNISVVAIEEMLVQHLLTERLFRTVFDNADFLQRNVIAVEIEKVIRALTSRSFSRSAYLKRLDHFYLAIEEAARTITEFGEKQAFLNTVYERFFQGFSRKNADTFGVVYTPQPVVDFMINSVDEVLQREFGLSLSAPGVVIVDPATGTGNFVVNMLRKLNGRDRKRKYRDELFANEVMLLPYYIAALNIEHAYYELTGEYAPFEGICFVDTLDIAENPQMSLFSEENTDRVEREKAAPINVVIGNPPYNVGQLNENDNNKNRKYDVIDKRVRETYVKDSKATLKTQLYDAYVKFFRWAVDRLQGRDGIVCYVSNNSFVDQIAFDGMRKHMAQDFDLVYHLDLHGNVRQNPKLSGTTHNVFGIQVGVGITIAVRNRQARAKNSDNDSPPRTVMLNPSASAQGRLVKHLDDSSSNSGEIVRSAHYDSEPANSGEIVRSAHYDSEPANSGDTDTPPSTVMLNEVKHLGDAAKKSGEIVRSAHYDIEAAQSSGERHGVTILYHRVPEFWRATEKLLFLSQAQTAGGIAWQTLTPDAKQTWVTEGLQADFDTFLPIGTKEAKAQSSATSTIFKTYSGGVKSNRDEWVYDFDRSHLAEKVQRLIETYNSEVDRWQRRSDRNAKLDDFVMYDERLIKWSGDLKVELTRGKQALFASKQIRNALYRPFAKRFLYFDELLNNSRYLQHIFFPTPASEQENMAICITDLGSEKPFMALVTQATPDLHLVGAGASAQCFPFYTYDEDGGNRRENIGDWALAQFQNAYGATTSEIATNAGRSSVVGSQAITKRDIFDYVYAVLHHPAYRAKYAENLKRELPRIPLVGSAQSFHAYAAIGRALAELHSGYERVAEYPLRWVENRDVPFSWRVSKMRLSKDKTELWVNESLTLAGIPAECFGYRLGNRSALEWVIDQYQAGADKRSGITSDPNRPDDEEYIVRLVGRVITVSIETQRLVAALPAWEGAA